jgi:hypothetical protein
MAHVWRDGGFFSKFFEMKKGEQKRGERGIYLQSQKAYPHKKFVLEVASAPTKSPGRWWRKIRAG